MAPNQTLLPSANAVEPLRVLQKVISVLEALGIHYITVTYSIGGFGGAQCAFVSASVQ